MSLKGLVGRGGGTRNLELELLFCVFLPLHEYQKETLDSDVSAFLIKNNITISQTHSDKSS